MLGGGDPAAQDPSPAPVHGPGRGESRPWNGSGPRSASTSTRAAISQVVVGDDEIDRPSDHADANPESQEGTEDWHSSRGSEYHFSVIRPHEPQHDVTKPSTGQSHGHTQGHGEDRSPRFAQYQSSVFPASTGSTDLNALPLLDSTRRCLESTLLAAVTAVTVAAFSEQPPPRRAVAEWEGSAMFIGGR